MVLELPLILASEKVKPQKVQSCWGAERLCNLISSVCSPSPGRNLIPLQITQDRKNKAVSTQAVWLYAIEPHRSCPYGQIYFQPRLRWLCPFCLQPMLSKLSLSWSAGEIISERKNQLRSVWIIKNACQSLYSGPNIFSIVEAPKSHLFGLGTALFPLSQLEAPRPQPRSTAPGAGTRSRLHAWLPPASCSRSSGAMTLIPS